MLERRKHNHPVLVDRRAINQQREETRHEEDDSISILGAVVTAEIIESVFDSTPSPDPTPDFGGFDGGSTGGAGAGGDW